MIAIPLNALQRLFQSWDAVHPYNAAQAFLLRGELPIKSAEQAWNDALAALRLGHAVIQAGKLTHCEARAFQSVHIVPRDVSLEDYLAAELDRPFAADDVSPFRPFSFFDGENSWFGLSYRHCVADSVSIRMLLREWLMWMIEKPTPVPRVEQARVGYWKLFAAGNGRTSLNQPLTAFVAGHQRLRSARKPLTVGPGDYPSRVLVRRAPDGLAATLRASCRAQQVRVSDVMLAALLEAASQHIPLQDRPNRQDVAVGCMIDLRPQARQKIDDVFGLFLGFTSIVCGPSEYSSWPRLLQSVRTQTQRHRDRGIAATCTTWITAALAASAFIPRRQTYHFYRKTMPLAAGLSSVNLNKAWPMEFFPSPLLDYLRISPTGPIAPVVLSATEMGSRLTLALTYRPGVVQAGSAEDIVRCVIGRLEQQNRTIDPPRVDNQPLT